MRFRQYRVVVFVFLIIAVSLYRMPRERQDKTLHDAKTQVGTFSPEDESDDLGGKGKWSEGHEGQKTSRPLIPVTTATAEKSEVNVDRLAHPADVAKSVEATAAEPKSTASAAWPVTSIASRPPIPAAKSTEPPTIPKQGLPDQNGTEVLSLPKPGVTNDGTILPVIHWQKQKEHFPVDSLIQLPTGIPKSIPKIQFDFQAETAEKKTKREMRKTKVREEFWHAWSGYKNNAYMHDELMPVNGASSDPFCGWAATLIDGLDTLWIMDFKSDFEEAVKSVGTIDFTTNIRNDIPMFETTIRYLGGMLGAYDISGAKYKTLLDKSVELAEVLMGAFDTPNRMPLLYYHWKPAYASQPHRAGTRANFAELGSMSLEFTRLAQLTGEAKYYDAIARITNALADWQKRGTKLPGVFPDDVDISGCNMTEQTRLKKEKQAKDFALQDQSEPVGYAPPQPNLPAERKPDKAMVDSAPELKLEIIPGEVTKGHLEVVEKVKPAVNKLSKRQSPEHGPSPTTTRDFEVPEFDCPAQGLTGNSFGGREGFSMGGGQDSSYEYFPKVSSLCFSNG
jgi:mannosyl-oligosaccharide alpha-1,2-mannosidase